MHLQKQLDLIELADGMKASTHTMEFVMCICVCVFGVECSCSAGVQRPCGRADKCHTITISTASVSRDSEPQDAARS